METNTNRSIDLISNEVRKCLEGLSIYEMTFWVRDHAQHLTWVCNYNKSKVNATMQPFMGVSYVFYKNFRDDIDVVDDFRELCVSCVLQLEINCK